MSGYELSGTSCVKSCAFPCATCDASLNCLTCFGGYELSGSSCASSVSCNSGSSCTSCPLGYVLNAGTCNQCTANGCLACNFATLNLCKLCKSGMYLITATNLCGTCTSPCSTCQTDTLCTTCVDGYYMQTVNNLDTGKCLACDSNCKTCANNPTSCLSCPTGSSLVGLKCLSTQNIGFGLTFSSPTASSLSSEYQAFMGVIE